MIAVQTQLPPPQCQRVIDPTYCLRRTIFLETWHIYLVMQSLFKAQSALTGPLTHAARVSFQNEIPSKTILDLKCQMEEQSVWTASNRLTSLQKTSTSPQLCLLTSPKTMQRLKMKSFCQSPIALSSHCTEPHLLRQVNSLIIELVDKDQPFTSRDWTTFWFLSAFSKVTEPLMCFRR